MNDKQKVGGPRIPKENLDYVDLWKYFEARGSEVKATMFKVVTWILGFAVVLFGIIVTECFNWKGTGALVSQPLGLVVFGAVGIAIVYYTDIVICDFGDHINRNFDRADTAREGDKSIDEIWEAGEAKKKDKTSLPDICKTIRKVSKGFLVVFVLLVIIGIITMLLPPKNAVEPHSHSLNPTSTEMGTEMGN